MDRSLFQPNVVPVLLYLQVRRSGRASIVVFCLAAVMVIGGVCVAGFGITGMVKAFKSGQGVGFTSVCAT